MSKVGRLRIPRHPYRLVRGSFNLIPWRFIVIAERKICNRWVCKPTGSTQVI